MSRIHNPYLFYTKYYIISGAYQVINVVNEILTYSASYSDNMKEYLRNQVASKQVALNEFIRNEQDARVNANHDNDVDEVRRSVNANESVHYHHCSNGYSCHGRVEPVTILDIGVTSTDVNESVHYNHFNDGDSCHGHVERSLCPPSWVHVFVKSTRPSSIRSFFWR